MEEKEYLNFQEAEEYTGKKRATLYQYIRALGITSHKFKRDKRKYLAKADVERIKETKMKPWLAGEDVKGVA